MLNKIHINHLATIISLLAVLVAIVWFLAEIDKRIHLLEKSFLMFQESQEKLNNDHMAMFDKRMDRLEARIDDIRNR